MIKSIFAVIYISVGAVFSYFRWTQYVETECAFYERERQRFLNYHAINGTEIPEHLKFEWRNMVSGHQRLKSIPPKYTDHTGEIIFDVLLWWLSLIDLGIRKGYRATTLAIWKLFNRVAASKMEQINKDLKG
jgi:hypothetical protein